MQRKERGRVMFVSSEGYDEERFKMMYEKIRKKLDEVDFAINVLL